MLGVTVRAARASRLPPPRLSRAASATPASSDTAGRAPSLTRLQIDPAHVVAPEQTMQFPDKTVPDIVWGNVSKWQDRVAVECGLTGRRLTYAQLRDASRRLAVVLRSPRILGLSDDASTAASTAAVMCNSPEYATVLLGALEAGVPISSVNPSYTPEEMSRQLGDCGARVVFTEAAVLPVVRRALELLGGSPRTLVVAGPGDTPSGAVRLDDLTGPGTPLEGNSPMPHDPDGIAVVPYSSGTTGLPKGVLLPHRSIVANLLQLQHPAIARIRQAHGDFQEQVPAVLPFFHIYGMVIVLLNSLCEGAHVVTLPKFEPQSFIRNMVQHKASGLYAAPPLLLFLAGPQAPKEALDALHFAMCGAAPLGAADVERLFTKAPKDLIFHQGYGMTESSPVLTQGRVENVAAVGRPVPSTHAVVVDPETGVSLPPTATGELCFRGPQMMRGYWRQPEETARTLTEGGWLRTGDIGRMDDMGDFVIMDRAKELIKVKGFQVAPAELEELLRAQEGVADAAVVGVADERSGEVPRAFVVPRATPADAAAAAALRTRLQERVAASVAPYKRLAGGVRLVAAIPKNTTGKILRRCLRDDPPQEIAL